jgi:hypothetical protein
MEVKFAIPFLFITLLLSGCGGTVLPANPIKELKKQYKDKNAYTIILDDMDLQEGQFVHKYKILEPLNGSNVQVDYTDWKAVDDDFFLLHEDDLGMEVFSKRSDGKYNSLVTPPGFTHFIGNDKFGAWSPLDSIQTQDSSRVWMFIENDQRIHSLESDLGLKGLSVTKGEYDRFQDKYYLNRPFYGEKIAKDSTKYGTRSRHWVIIRPFFYSRRITKNNFDKPYGGSFSYQNRGGGGFGK